ncbi:hypothetical protein P43SY_007696 [Pythium insidiosum]|uniref:HTH myb-type domain-containing protein n=1 Tax=Pythium insidiosum TaxID=114742 RepID=A0AAD5LFM3_PYTIN|nr:hypothetical protein P43SY_007696 [Pythium insidiosum]
MMDLSAHESAAASLYRSSGDSKSGIVLADDDKWTSGEDATGGMADDAPSSPEAETHAGRKYARKTKRFAWPDELHRLFVAAIFDLGLKNASPKALLPFMQPTAAQAGLTTEHLKSHLQKYRLHYDKSRAEFLAFYAESAQRNGKRRRRSSKSSESHTKFIFPIVPQGPSAVGAAGDMSIEVPEPLPEPLQAPAVSPTVSSPFGIPPVHSQAARHLERMNLLRLDQQNAAAAAAFALAAASLASNQSMPPPLDSPFARSGFTPRGGLESQNSAAADAGDPQWGILASLLSPQPSGAAVAPNTLPAGMREPFALGGSSRSSQDSGREAAPPDLQMQMHLAMQAQMNLHRQMLHRKVAVSQHYLNQAAAAAVAAAAEKRAATSTAMPTSFLPPQEPVRRVLPAPAAPPASRPSLPTDSLGPWDQMDMDMEAEDAMDLFSFLKTTE